MRQRDEPPTYDEWVELSRLGEQAIRELEDNFRRLLHRHEDTLAREERWAIRAGTPRPHLHNEGCPKCGRTNPDAWFCSDCVREMQSVVDDIPGIPTEEGLSHYLELFAKLLPPGFHSEFDEEAWIRRVWRARSDGRKG